MNNDADRIMVMPFPEEYGWGYVALVRGEPSSIASANSREEAVAVATNNLQYERSQRLRYQNGLGYRH